LGAEPFAVDVGGEVERASLSLGFWWGTVMPWLKWMSPVGLTAALLFAGAPAGARSEIYQERVVWVCPDIPHYPNAESVDPYNRSFDSRSAYTRTTDNWLAVVDWFRAHLGTEWTYREPVPDERPNSFPMFLNSAGENVAVLTDRYPIEITYRCR
jgi:hypothetical protein